MLKALNSEIAVAESGKQRDTLRFLPLTPVAFEILLSVAQGERHGYGIMQDIEDSTDGRMRLNPGTLYRAIGRLVDSGLLQELSARSAPDLDDARRRYYSATPLGLRVAKAEARRLEVQIAAARAKRLLGKS
jgi:DNA-binding PadR family transcriptional regulator